MSADAPATHLADGYALAALSKPQITAYMGTTRIPGRLSGYFVLVDQDFGRRVIAGIEAVFAGQEVPR